MGYSSSWDGVRWQTHVLLLLKYRYGPDGFQEVPDHDRGDCGIEGFSRDGCVFQCYAPKGLLSTAQLVQNINKKITKDIRKFVKNQGRLTPILGALKVHCWTLVVPRFPSKEIIEHAESKAHEIRAQRLPCAAETFYIQVITDDHFAVERQLLLNAGLSQIHIDGQTLDSDIDGWLATNQQQVATMTEKIGKLDKPAAAAAKLGREMIKHYVSSQNALAQLHDSYSEVYESVVQCRADRETFLTAESLIATDLPAVILRNTVLTYREDLNQRVPGIDKFTSQLLTLGTVADWLIRCPLDFH